jgi:hypothetical protein
MCEARITLKRFNTIHTFSKEPINLNLNMKTPKQIILKNVYQMNFSNSRNLSE